ncbi:MAG: hypothetical protein WD059_07815 [Balneolaceae bacterium]
MKKYFSLFILFLFLISPAMVSAQYFSYNPQHRPAGLNWQQIKTDHFRIIFPHGEDSLARRAAAILEDQYPAASDLTGGTLKNFPVVLKSYNDFSNGFVTSFNFRSEIDLSPLKGKSMNPKTGDWLETVLPHELVHATHFNVQQDKREQKVSLPNLISYFSPDLARSFHGFVPVGIHEGLAVYFETEEITPQGGRGNYTFSTNRFNANFGGPERWNMGQTLIPSDYSLPGNRHYIAGYSFTDWLHDTYGESVSKEAIRMHYSHFMLGYGYALRRVTGKWPGQLYDLYEQEMEQNEEKRLSQLPINTTEKSRIIKTPFKGEQAHGPKWLSDSELLFYGSFYNSRLGFYRYNLESDTFTLLQETFSVGDYNYEIDADSNFYYSSYSRDPLYSGVYLTDLHRLNLSTGEDISLTKKARVFAPTTGAGQIFGIQSLGDFGRIVEVLEDGNIKVLKEFTDANPVSIKINPVNDDQIAVLVNRRGTQALWLASISSLGDDLEREPTLAFREGSIHDPEWHPEGEKLLFAMDAAPSMNIFEYDLESEEIIQLTSSLYNAFEASYSPGGDSIAYIFQAGDEQRLAILSRSDFLNESLSNEELLTGEEVQQRFSRPLIGSEILENEYWEQEPYKAGLSWLKPRVVLPVIHENSGTTQAGAGISSIDALSGQSYYAEVTGIQERLWYDISYNNKTFYPGFELNAYSEPDFFVIQDQDQNRFATMQQTRGLSLSIPINYTFRGDTRLSSIYFDPEISAEQFKYFNLSPNEISDFATRYKAGIFSQLSLGILNLARDVQPSAGLSLFGLFEHTLNEPSVDITFGEGSARSLFRKQWSAYYGAFTYLSPLRRFNQSLRLDFRFLQQSQNPIYSNSTIVPMGFSENPFPASIEETVFNNIGRFSTRYTVPLLFPDTGGLTLPLYLSSVYLTGFSHTLTNLNSEDLDDLLASSRSIFGAGLHVQFKLSNVLFDFGLGIAYEPTRNKPQFIFGQF